MMLKRFFDIVFSFFAILILLIPSLLIGILIITTSKGGMFFLQKRVGRFGKTFQLYKFRTMFINSDKKSLITIGNNDSRITKIGYFLRKTKIDELPQLLNILFGKMSFVGPRPEVQKYVDLYDKNQKRVLAVKPGLTDYASIKFFNENELLANEKDPEKYYIENIMPEKLRLNLEYIEKMSFCTDLKIIFKTLIKIF